MSAAEDDTELRDLLIQNLENNGVLNKLKAEMRAAVFLAMDEQDKVENKTPLVNENLKKCLSTREGHLVASLIIDFLQVFSLDFTLAVFQPEINSLNGLDSRDQVCRELGFSESEVNRNSPLLLELARRGRHKDKSAILSEQGDKPAHIPKELSPKQTADARKKFDSYDRDRSGSVGQQDLKSVFTDLFPSFSKNMLERFISDELRAADKSFSKTIDFQEFLGLYQRLFTQCRSVVVQDSAELSHPPSRFTEEKIATSLASKIPRYKGHKQRGQEQRAAKGMELNRGDSSVNSLGKGDFQLGSRHSEASGDSRNSSTGLKRVLDLELEVEEDPDDGDSFFDDPLPKPQKTYGCLSVLASDSEGEKDDPLSEHSHKQSHEPRRMEASGARESPAGSLSEPDGPRPGGAGSTSEPSHSRNGNSNSREKGARDLKAMNDKTGSLLLDDDVEYDDDFNSHRSDLSKSELSIGEEIEEVSIEGPDNSEKFDESTQDLSVSQLSQSHGADYMEEVA
ncbi:centrosomal protein 43 isoform X2 [Centroberyx affinis]|uniref:centrosomal protein 43 isoform X2 n=1 Tax=Centroberyx affinis TaxID=166261 RepID=UPI003A5B9B0E